MYELKSEKDKLRGKMILFKGNFIFILYVLYVTLYVHIFCNSINYLCFFKSEAFL